jgi:ParB-like chromosome segregation protein Spo0J
MKLIDKVKIIDIDKIYPYINNPKEHPEEQINKIASSIKNYGFTVPIVVDEDNEIIAGHGRYEAARKLELEELPVIRRDDLNKAQVKGLRLSDNRVTESEWNYEQLAVEFEELEFDDYDLELTGFNEEEINDITENYDIPEEEPEFDESIADEVEMIKCPECGHEFPK